MKYFELDTKSQFEEKNLCLAIGNFDGFHKGHIAIFNSLKKIASDNNQPTAIMSFNPHPREFFDKKNENFNIYSKIDKINFLKKFNIDIYIEFVFDKKLSELSANQFVENILINKLDIKNVVVGKDFKFGKDRSGNFILGSSPYEIEGNDNEKVIEIKNMRLIVFPSYYFHKTKINLGKKNRFSMSFDLTSNTIPAKI